MRLKFVEEAPMGLERSEEQRLAALAQEGDVEAMQALVMGNIRWAVKYTLDLMRRYNIPPDREEDMIQESFMAMTRAARAFKPGFGKFTTYSTQAINHSVTDRMGENGFRVPGYMRHAVHIYSALCRDKEIKTYEDAEAAGIVQKTFEKLKESENGASWKRFPQLLKQAIHLTQAKTKSLPDEGPKDESSDEG